VMVVTETSESEAYDGCGGSLVQAAAMPVRDRRSASVWTMVHPIFALGQLAAFLVSVGFLIAFAFHGASFAAVKTSVFIKISLMVGAVVTGALWERDVYGFYWFAPEFLAEDVMTLIVFLSQVFYLAMVAFHPDEMVPILASLGFAYTVYVANVAQYIHKTQRAKLAAAAVPARAR